MTGLFSPQDIVPAFDRHLGRKKLTFSAVAIGGAALSILGVITRHTRDLDLLEAEIPEAIRKAAVEFAKLNHLADDWLNVGPAKLSKHLPHGWRKQTQLLFEGTNLKLATLARLDLIRIKLWAMCDRMRDIDDLVALAPSEEELAMATEWVTPLDAHTNWPEHVATNVAALRRRLGRE
jgi:hypothetical protein